MCLAIKQRLLVLLGLVASLSLLQGCGGGYSGSTTNPAPTLQAIKVTPTYPILSLAGSRQFKATGTYSDGTSLDLTPQVTWAASTNTQATSNITIQPNGIATGIGLGPSTITATMGPVGGALSVVVSTNGYASNTLGTLIVPFGNTVVDAVYMPDSQHSTGGTYSVLEMNLDADLFTGILPVQVSLIGTIPMPKGFVPNATIAVDSTQLVAVISYSSPNVVVIDASNDPNDPASNTILGNFASPITKTVTFKGKTCMICAAVQNPANGQIILSTAQGYYTMDLTTGVFTALAFTPPALPAANFALNPIAASPYIVSTTFGQNPNTPAEVQVLDLTTNRVVADTTFGLIEPQVSVLDVALGLGAVIDPNANTQALLTITSPQNITPNLVPNVGFCPSETGSFDMAVMAVGANPNPLRIPHTLATTQANGDCVGFEAWPSTLNVTPPFPQAVPYAYGSMPAAPDGVPFANSSDPNAIATFTSVVDKKNYLLLVDAGGQWLAKINPSILITPDSTAFLPGGAAIPPGVGGLFVQGMAGDPVVYLPTSGIVSLSATSIAFGNQTVGTTSIPNSVIFTNASGTTSINISSVALAGTNTGDFGLTTDCPSLVSPKGTCTISVTFTPGAQGARAATVNITDDGGNSPQTIALTGTGS